MEVLEFHDTHLASITFEGRDAVLLLRPGYIHRSEGRPGVDEGSGWLQDLDLIILDATCSGVPDDTFFEPADIADGTLAIDQVIWENLLPLPFSRCGTSTFTAILATGRRLDIRGSGARVVPRSEPTFLEWCPRDWSG